MKSTEAIEITQRDQWLQVARERINDLQTIVRVLVEFDERSGRADCLSEPELHFARKTIATASSDDVRYYLKPGDEFMFFVIAELQTQDASLVTMWMHEDGVAKERVEWEGKSHPTHGILCLTDFYEKYSTEELGPEGEAEPSEGVFKMMQRVDRSQWIFRDDAEEDEDGDLE